MKGDKSDRLSRNAWITWDFANDANLWFTLPMICQAKKQKKRVITFRAEAGLFATSCKCSVTPLTAM